MARILARKDWHKSVTEDRVMQLVEKRMRTLDNPGVCLACGASHYDCEPDARFYECEECSAKFVFGAEEILMMM